MNLTIANLFKVPEIRNKILITLGLLLVYRIGFFIPLPGVDFAESLRQQRQAAGDQGGLMQVFTLVNLLTGGSLQSATIFSLGVMPYISASIIFSLLSKAIPSLEKIAKEGQSGQRKINQYTRLATVGICLIQSWFVIIGALSGKEGKLIHQGVSQWLGLYYIVVMVALTAGTMFIMWLGEQITEHGIGNGISLIIMAGIVSGLSPALPSLTSTEDYQQLLLFLAVWAFAVVAVVYMTKAQRRIPIQQPRHTKGTRTVGGDKRYLPFKLNQANVMPIIFGSALLLIPSAIGTAFSGTSFGGWLELSFGGERGFWFVASFTVLIFFFAFFWTSMMFQPNEIANNLKENGSFIPTVTPGKPTAEFLEKTMVRLTLAGSTFLAIVAVMPTILRTGGGGSMSQAMIYFMSGTSILIVVSVALDMVEKLNAMLLMRNYETFNQPTGEQASGGSGFGGSGSGGSGSGGSGSGGSGSGGSGWGRRSR
jgi:preprotein translocase subunit SecY